MNNSKIIIDNLNITLESESDKTPKLREKEGELLKIIESINGLYKNNDWVTLKSVLFDKVLEKLEKNLKLESEKDLLDNPKIYKLQGEIKWARKYADLSKLNDEFRLELSNIRKLIEK